MAVGDAVDFYGETNLVVDIVGYYSGGSGNGYVPVTPARIADSRANRGLELSGHTLTQGGTATVTVPDEYGDNVPTNATAVVLNVTEVNANVGGYFTVYPTGTAKPATTSVSFPAGVTSNNEVTVALGTSGDISIWNENGTADVLVDVEGYYLPASGTAAYTYNGDNLEASITPAGAQTPNQFDWDTTGPLPLILSDGTNDYIYGPTGTPVEQINVTTSTPTYLTYTASDSTWISTNAVGDETGYWGYDAYGTLAFGTPTSPFGYSGQYQDSTTGLVNDRARFYQAQTGSFTTRDPAFASTDTAYTYAGDDPVNQSDPTGLGVGYTSVRTYCPDGRVLYGSQPCTNGGLHISKTIQSIGSNIVDNAQQVGEIALGTAITVVGGGLCVAGSAGLDVVTGGGALVLTPSEVIACGAIAGAGVGISAQGIQNWHASSNCSSAGGGDSELIPSSQAYDPEAQALAQRIGGQAQVEFASGPNAGREFDAISDEYVAQSKPANFTGGSSWRGQARATFQAAIDSGRTPYFQFNGAPSQSVLDTLQRYAQEYGVQPVIDTEPLGGS